MSKTSSLCIIAPDKKTAQRITDTYGKYFDEVILELAPNCEDFSEARNRTLKRVKTDYWFWLDTDDDIKYPERIKDLINMMETEGFDAVYLPYEYGYNEQKELIALHYRERLLRTSHPFEWKGVVHESCISDSNPKGVKSDDVIVSHAYKDEDDIMRSALRNHKIMEKAVKAGDDDPRLIYYLGRSYFMLKKYQESAQTLLEYTKVSGWDEQKYDAWLKISDSLIMMDEHERGINALWEAIKLNPSWPDAWLKIGDLYLYLEQPGRAIDFLKAGISKKPPETLEIIDPTLYTYRPLVSLALCYFGLAKVEEAKRYIDQAAQFQPKTPAFKSAYKAINTAFIEEKTIKSAAWLGKFVEQQGDVKKYVDGLPPFIRNDLRLRPLWSVAHPPIKWPQKSIVFYCGEQWEEWGPDTLDKGMGGSEEAIVYLSRELTKLGWQVTVYNQRVEEYEDWVNDKEWGEGKIKPVTYKPWEHFNPEDEFDVFVAWRNPWMAEKLKIKARLKCVDMHDTPIGHQSFPEKALKSVDKVFLKGNFQKEMGAIPDDKAVVVSNGIVGEQFENLGVKRNPHKVIYASSSDRGLDVLLELWPKIKEQVPDAELVWPYGWNSYDAMHKGSAEHGRWKWNVIRKMHEVGAKELGRLSHEDLAKEMASCGVWAYPTSFPEINCITAIKAQAAGLEPITSGYAALQETILDPETPIEDIHEKPEELDKFVKRVVKALKNPMSEEDRKKMSKRAIEKYNWSVIAKTWSDALDNPDSHKSGDSLRSERRRKVTSV